MKKILLIEDERSMRLGLAHSLKSQGYSVKAVADGAEGIHLIGTESFDVVVTDLKLPGANGIEVLKAVKSASFDAGVMIITAFADVKTAVEAMKEGAYDYIAKPFDPDELLIVIERFFKQRELEHENIRLREEIRECKHFEQIIGASPGMQLVFDKIRAVAKTDSDVIIYGESGTGKELVANAIYNLSARRDKPFVKINCAAIPEALLESELFGHEKGAFTGAVQRRKGKFEVAQGGTIFLDEVGDLPIPLQAKLLRVIENRSFERLGGNESITIDVRIVYATSKSLKKEEETGKFRRDLYYRLNVLPIQVPPLRERREDISLLIRHFLGSIGSNQGKPDISIAPDALEALLQYDYPGNVRELKHAVEMAVTFCPGKVITLPCLPAEMRVQMPDLEHIQKDTSYWKSCII